MNKPSHDFSRRARVMSAKVSSNRSRPMSSYTSKNFQKTQGLEQIYNGGRDTSPNRRTPQKSVIYPGMNTQQLMKFKRPATFKTNKDREQLFDENMKLKRENHKLQEELLILRGKFQARGKKSKQRNKQLDIEFQKPLYWGGSKTHLISGIKFQYDKLRQDYAHLQKQLANTKAELLQTKTPQLEVYAKQLQTQNIRLKHQLQNLINSQTSVSNESNKQMLSYLYAQSQQNKRKLEHRFKQTSTILQSTQQALKDTEKKIAFMEKLIIEKDNRGYHLHRKVLKLQKTIETKQNEICILSTQISRNNQKHESEVKFLRDEFMKNMRRNQEKYESQIEKRDRAIRNYEEENKQMQTMINKLRMNSNATFINSTNKSMIEMRKDARDMTHTNLFGNKSSHENLEDQTNALKMGNYASALSNYASELTNQKSYKQEKKQRVRQTADKKFSQNARKTRKVEHSQITEIAQLLKYRMIGHKIDSNKLKTFFHCNKKQLEQLENRMKSVAEGQELTLSSQDQGLLWQKQYISMKETQSIFSNAPFSLSEEQAELISRYVIEDATTQYVYCDENNENKREIVKSIIRSLIGEYETVNKLKEERLQDFMNKYSSNLESALKSYYPSGTVSNRKFVDVFSSLGYDHSEMIEDELLGMMAIHSEDLNSLQYRFLFQEAGE